MRIEAIDFWRGAVLLVIMIDHVPGNGLEWFTPRNFSLSDSAEAFVFLSGFSVGAAYWRRAAERGFLSVSRACAARAFAIYRVHLALTAAAVAAFAIAYALSGDGALIAAHGRSFVFADPRRALAGLALMSHQLGYVNILPMYVVLMLIAPVLLMMARASLAAALAVSGLVYVATVATGFNLPNWPEPGGWFFNPFAWQLMFALGLCAAIRWREAPLPGSRLAFAGALAVLSIGAAIVTDGFGFAPGLRDAALRTIDARKQTLGWGRALSFVALAYALAQWPPALRLARCEAGAALRRLGRHSLAVFAFGSGLAAVGQAFLPLAGRVAGSAFVESLALVYTLACLIGLHLLARAIEWDRTKPGEPGEQAAPRRFGAPFALARALRLASAR